MKYILSFLLIFSLTFPHSAQVGLKKYGTHVLQEIIRTSGGGYYALGTRNDTFTVLIKLDSGMNPIWEKHFAGPKGQRSVGYKIYENTDHSVFILGAIYNSNLLNDLSSWLLKLNSDGEILWNKTYNNCFDIYALCPDPAGGYFLGGSSNLRGITIDGVVMKIDNSGNFISKFNFQYNQRNVVKHLEILPNGSLLIGGMASGNSSQNNGIFFISRKSDGSENYRTVYPADYYSSFIYSPNYHFPLSTVKSNNGNIKMVITTGNYQFTQMIEFNSTTGQFTPHSKYGDQGDRVNSTGIMTTKKGDYLIYGYNTINTNNSEIRIPFALLVTQEGKVIWRKKYEMIDSSSIFICATASDQESIIFAGFNQSPTSFLYKIQGDGYAHSNRIYGKVYYDLNSNCTIDTADYGIENVILKNLSDPNNYAVSGSGGHFELRPESQEIQIKGFAPNEFQEFCEAEKKVSLDSITGQATTDFILKPIDACPHLDVQILQPDLVRCKNSRFLITITNLGGVVSNPDELLIHYDKDFTWVSGSPGGDHFGNTVKYNISSLKPFEKINIELDLFLDCQVILGASHQLIAKLSGSSCGSIWKGPDLILKTICKDQYVQTEITNVGGDMAEPALYKVYLDQFQRDEGEFKLSSGQSIRLNYSCHGQSYFIEIEDSLEILKPGTYLSEFKEGCGSNAIGLYSLGYDHAFSKWDPNRSQSKVLAGNTSVTLDKIQESITGLGHDHVISRPEWLEYTLRIKNKLNEEVNRAEISLTITDNLDVSSYQILGCNGIPTYVIPDRNHININISNLLLTPAKEEAESSLYLKFRIKTVDPSPSDSTEEVFSSVTGSVFLQDSGPYPILKAYHTIKENPTKMASEQDVYSRKVNILGGRHHTFGERICETHDGSFYLFLSTSSFKANSYHEPYIIKLNHELKYEWGITLNLNSGNFNFSSIAPTSDGACILAGTFLPYNSKNTIENYSVGIVKLDKAGIPEFEINFKPGPNDQPGYANQIIRSKDGNYLVTGVCFPRSNAADHFLAKIDLKGNILWKKIYEVENLAISTLDIHEQNNGDIIVSGSDYGRELLAASKTDKDGNSIWIKTISPQLGHDTYRPRSVINAYGDIVFISTAQWSDPFTGESFITPHFILMDNNGKYISEKTPVIGDFSYSWAEHITADQSGNYLIFGEIITDSLDFGSKAMIAKFDKDLNTLWYNEYGTGRHETFHFGLIDSNGRIHAIGNNQAVFPDQNLQAVYLITDENGKEITQISKPKNQPGVHVSPIPTKEFLQVILPENISTDNLSWSILDLNGQLLLHGNFDHGKIIPVSTLSSGMYLLKFNRPELKNEKILIQR